MTVDKTLVEGNGHRKLSENARRALSMLDQIRTITPADIRDTSDEVRRELMILLGCDPDEPLPDEIIQLIEEFRRKADDK